MPKVVAVEASLTKEKVADLKSDDKENNFTRLPEAGIPKVSINFDFGANPAEAGKYFGDDVIMKLLKFAISHPIQSRIRDGLAARCGKGMPVAQAVKEIQAEVFNEATGAHVWKPGLGATRKSAVEKEAKRLKGLDPSKRKAEIEALTAMLEGLE